MVNFRIIARIFGLLLIAEGFFMLLSAGVCFLYRERAVSSFLFSALITILTGAIVFTPLRKEERVSGNKEGYIIVAGFWLLFSLFGTLPFLFSGSAKSFPDAFFESMSGFTTTGATVFTNIESLPHGILFWRSLTQWLGGMGIIFISLSIFPVVRSINIQIAATEFTGYQIEKIHPRIKDAARRLMFIYFALTVAEAVLLTAGGMPVFDALCNSFTTMSTGGFTTRNNGIASFASPFIMTVITIFMFLAGTNPAMIYFAMKGRIRKVILNSEFVFYFRICAVFILVSSLILFFRNGSPAGKSIGDASFHVISIITTTGFYTQNWNIWAPSMILILFILMFPGGSSGSTSGGIKIIRLLLIRKNGRQELKRIIHPNAFLPVRLGEHIVQPNTINNVLVFFILYFFVICISTFVVAAMGYDMVTSFSTSASMLANIGPAIGKFGPFSNYSDLPVFGKFFLPVIMLLGRLELLTIMILFTRSFYRN
jgi:trk system potassium uptake protein TrkH